MEQFREFTPTQNRLFNVLRDGLSHSKQELKDQLRDELQADNGLNKHVSNMRKILRAKGLDIVCKTHGRARPNTWQLVRLYLPDE